MENNEFIKSIGEGEFRIAGQWTLNRAEELKNTLLNLKESLSKITISSDCEMDLVGAQLLLSLLREKKITLDQDEFSAKYEFENSGLFKTLKS